MIEVRKVQEALVALAFHTGDSKIGRALVSEGLAACDEAGKNEDDPVAYHLSAGRMELLISILRKAGLLSSPNCGRGEIRERSE